MARVIVNRDLPPVHEALKSFRGFRKGKSQQFVIAEQLRLAAAKLITEKSQPFYAMRDVARFFRVPLGTVALVYQTLEREGIINRIRSSRTMLIGREPLSREAVRGVVGLPIWLRSIVHMTYTRTLVMDLEEHLRQSGYVADIIFHEKKEEEAEPGFATRLLRHRLDAVLLHTPIAECRQNILSLSERGVRVLIIQRKEARRDLPAVLYLQDYQPAYQEMATRWHQSGIHKVWLCSPLEHLHYKSEADHFRAVVERHGLQMEQVGKSPEQLLQQIRRAKRKGAAAVAFLDSTYSDHICNRQPQLIEEISRHARLAFCAGSIQAPYLQERGLHVDKVDFSPSKIASRLAHDISQLSIVPDGVRDTFVSDYREQVLI